MQYFSRCPLAKLVCFNNPPLQTRFSRSSKDAKSTRKRHFFSLFRQQKTLHKKSLILSDTITRARITERELKPTDGNAEEEEEGETRFGRRRFRFRRAQTRVLVSFLIEKKQIFIAQTKRAQNHLKEK